MLFEEISTLIERWFRSTLALSLQTIQKRLYKEQNCDIPGFSKGISVANTFSSLRVTYSCFLLQKQRRDIQKFSSSKTPCWFPLNACKNGHLFLVFYSKTVFSFILVSNTIEGLLFWKSIHVSNRRTKDLSIVFVYSLKSNDYRCFLKRFLR
jgi:hypothetical protein